MVMPTGGPILKPDLYCGDLTLFLYLEGVTSVDTPEVNSVDLLLGS